MKIVIESAGVGEGHPKDKCSFCGKDLPNEDDRIATCTVYEYVTLCKECYNKAGSSVR